MDQGWTIHIEAAGDGPAVDDRALDAFLQILAEWSAAVSTTPNGDRYTATISIDDDDLAHLDAIGALELGSEIFEKHAALSGLPSWPIVRAEVMTHAEQDADLARPAMPELVGIAEIADILDVTRQRASALQTNAQFPRPVALLRSGPVWTRDSLNHFVDTWDRKGGRPRKEPDMILHDGEGKAIAIELKTGPSNDKVGKRGAGAKSDRLARSGRYVAKDEPTGAIVGPPKKSRSKTRA